MQGKWRTDTMIEQMGGLGINGAFIYTGARKVSYKCRDDDSKPLNSKVLDNGLIDYEIGIQYKPNIGRNWKMIVSLEGDDTYTVRLWKPYTAPRAAKTGLFGEVVTEFEGVYDDMLQDIVESTYDNAIKEHFGGFISI